MFPEWDYRVPGRRLDLFCFSSGRQLSSGSVEVSHGMADIVKGYGMV